MIHKANKTSFQNEWCKVYKSEDPYVWPFVDSITTGRIFYPTCGCHLTARQFQAVMAADSLVGAEKIYIAGVEVGNFLENDICRWECVEPTYREYRNLPLVIENAMWSESGMWGLLVSQDDFAVLGGRRGFLEAIDEFYISWEVDRQRIREGVEDFEDLSWLNDLIARTI